MQELFVSMMKLTTAFTLFSMQQVQNAVGAAADSQTAINKFREALDAMTSSLETQIDDSKKETLKSMGRMETDLVGRTMDAFSVQALDPREVLNQTAEMMRKTTDSLADLVKKATPASSSNPVPAESLPTH